MFLSCDGVLSTVRFYLHQSAVRYYIPNRLSSPGLKGLRHRVARSLVFSRSINLESKLIYRILCLCKPLAHMQSVLGVFNRSLSVKLGIFPISCRHSWLHTYREAGARRRAPEMSTFRTTPALARTFCPKFKEPENGPKYTQVYARELVVSGLDNGGDWSSHSCVDMLYSKNMSSKLVTKYHA